MKQKAFTLMELMIVIVIIGILSAVGMVMFGGQSEKAKIAATNANFRNIQKFLVVEFFKCEFDSSELIFNTHKCSDSNPPTTSLIGNFISNKLRFKNPYNPTSSAISSNPCTLGTVSITSPSKGAYSLNYYSSLAKKITTAHIGTTWVPVKVSGSTTYKTITATTNACYKTITATTGAGYKTITPGSSGSYKQIKP